VSAAAMTTALPLSPEGGISVGVKAEGAPESEESLFSRYLMATPGYFAAMGIAMLRGSELPSRIDPGNTVVVINQAMADKLWPGQDALGKRIVMGDDRRTVIGVVANVRLDSLNLQPAPQMYMPMHEMSPGFMSVIVRGDAGANVLMAHIRESVRAVDRAQAVHNMRTMSDVISASVSPRRVNTLLLSVFGMVALTLAAIGVYGVLSYAVTQRTREIGVRVALGATTKAVVQLVLWRGIALTLVGLVIGFAGAYALARFLASMLYEVNTHDPLVFTLAPVVLGAIALLASWLPARRAARVDPVVALRAD
jgi:predicted permease